MLTLTLSTLKTLRAHAPERLGVPHVRRVRRSIRGGSFAKVDEYPHAWAVEIAIGEDHYVLYSARGERREWTDLNRLERFLREADFTHWHVVNELD